MRLILAPCLRAYLAAFTIALSACCLPRAGAQALVDSFTVGFSSQLGWQGDLGAFSGENGRLVLREGRPTPLPTARVWFPAVTRDSACWQLEVDQRFSASASNRLRWWLAADRPLNQSGVRGVYLQIGGISGNLDAIELVYESGVGPEVFAPGLAGIAAADPLTLKLEVCAQADRTWTWVARDTSGVLLDEASGVAPQDFRGQFSGFDVAFTATRSGLLSFDNLRISRIFQDLKAPELVLAKAEGPLTVVIIADESLDPIVNADPSAYLVNGLVPSAAMVFGDTVRLTLSQNLPSGIVVPVRLLRLSDLAGNVAPAITASVTYTVTQQLARFDLLISELMVDPSPVVGLPEFEYVEVYNAGASAVDLRDVRFANDRTSIAFPALLLAPGEYRAFAKDNLGDARFTSMPGLPALTNSGGTLRLLRADGGLVDEVTYTDASYRQGTADGGYALERQDLNFPCLLGASGFRSSSALAGGTPSAKNSEGAAFVPGPLTMTSVALSPMSTVLVTTNRALREPNTAFLLSTGAPFTVIEGALLGNYELVLAEPLAAGTIATLSLSGVAASCVPGESRSSETFTLGLPQRSRIGDWALNEIMYDPLSGQGRWLELANVSDRLLSLKGLVLARTSATGEVLARFTLTREVLVPGGDFLVVAADPVSLARQFPGVRLAQVVQATVPTLGSEDCVQLFDPVTEEIYFRVCYSEDWHNQAYAKTDGVSLERIDLSQSDGDSNNWTSAASTVGFATPTAANSQARTLRVADLATPFALDAERVSPDGDGFEDLLSVAYHFEESGVLGRFSIVDLRGYVIYEKSEDQSLGRSGVWTWDGIDNDRNTVGIGTYVLRIEYWSPERPAKRSYFTFSVLQRI